MVRVPLGDAFDLQNALDSRDALRVSALVPHPDARLLKETRSTAETLSSRARRLSPLSATVRSLAHATSGSEALASGARHAPSPRTAAAITPARAVRSKGTCDPQLNRFAKNVTRLRDSCDVSSASDGGLGESSKGSPEYPPS